MNAADPLPPPPSFRLDGRRALVTGAGKGLGRAAAAALADAGAHVTLVARTAADVEELAAAIGRAGGAAEAAALDVTDDGAVGAFLGGREPFRVLFNNAGTNRPAPALDVTEDDYDAVTDLNVKGAFFLARNVARGMVGAGEGGSIINMSSQMGHVGGLGRSVYCATKHAVEGFTKAMAWELAPHGIRVNTVCPTFIETPMTRPFLDEPGFRETMVSKIALGRLGRPEDVTGAVVFLAADASSLVTGASLMIDGGWTAV